MDKLIERDKLTKPTKKEFENVNRFTTSREIELVILNLPTKKSLGPDGFAGGF